MLRSKRCATLMPRPLNLSARGHRAATPRSLLAIAARARQLRGRGFDICQSERGEPDFDNAPPSCREAASEALGRGATRYGPAAGEPALRQAIANKLSAGERQIPQRRSRVLVNQNGGKQPYNLFPVLLGPGDELAAASPLIC